MAKKVSFGDKVRGGKSDKTEVHIKIVRSKFSKRTGGVRFTDEIIGVPIEENLENFVKNLMDK